MNYTNLSCLEQQSLKLDLLLRIQVRRPLNLWIFRVVVAKKFDVEKIRILGEMKGWAYSKEKGLQLDTMLVSPKAPPGVGDLIWTATMSWALEQTPCKQARLLAIYDVHQSHLVLSRYFRQRRFEIVREIGSSLYDLPLRMVWGGAGALMIAKCTDVFEYSYSRWQDLLP